MTFFQGWREEINHGDVRDCLDLQLTPHVFDRETCPSSSAPWPFIPENSWKFPKYLTTILTYLGKPLTTFCGLHPQLFVSCWHCDSQATNVINISHPKGSWENEFPFPLVGYVWIWILCYMLVSRRVWISKIHKKSKAKFCAICQAAVQHSGGSNGVLWKIFFPRKISRCGGWRAVDDSEKNWWLRGDCTWPIGTETS